MLHRRLGKKAARPGAVKFLAARYMADPADAPPVPKAFGHYGRGAGLDWRMLGNDRCGDCVMAGAAHETMVWTHRSGDGKPCVFTDANVLGDYAALTGFDPSIPESDQGTDMQEAASYRRKTGIVDASGQRHKIEAYAALRRGDVDQLARATYLFGAVGVGLQLPTSADRQFDAGQPWVPIPDGDPLGGHYVSCVGRNSAGQFLVVTWGRLQAMSADFYQSFNDESIVYFSPESIRDEVSPEGFDAAKLRADLASLSTKGPSDDRSGEG